MPLIQTTRRQLIIYNLNTNYPYNIDMKNIKVLGTGCANCKMTIKLIDEVAKAIRIEIELEKVEEMIDIIAYGVMSTPGMVIDGKVVRAGDLPSTNQIEEWLSGSSDDCYSRQTITTSTAPTGGCCS